MLLARLLRSIAMRSLEDVEPSCVKGHALFADGENEPRAPAPGHIGVRQSHVKGVVLLRIEVRLDVQGECAKQRDARPKSHAAYVPLVDVALIGTHGRKVVLEAAAELHPLHDTIRRIVVPLRELPDALVD